MTILEEILGFDEFSEEDLNGIDDEILQERLYILKMSLARAWARCGNRNGLLILADLLRNKRYTIAYSSLNELKSITGLEHDFNYNWKKMILNMKDKIIPKPWTDEIV